MKDEGSPPPILQKRGVKNSGNTLRTRASIGFRAFLGQLLNNTPKRQKKGLVLQRGLEGIPEPDGFERTRGDNRWKHICFRKIYYVRVFP